MKQVVAPLQANEVSIIRRKLATFDVKQHEFREKFRKTAPFPFDSNDIYVRIDGVSKICRPTQVCSSLGGIQVRLRFWNVKKIRVVFVVIVTGHL